jgi:hypothetical protein
MDEQLRRDVADLTQALADLTDRVNLLTAHLHGPTATQPAGTDVDATLARAARLAALRGVQPEPRPGG